MAEFLIKVADERGHLLQQVETGYSESEVRDRFVQQGYLVYWVKPRGLFGKGYMAFIKPFRYLVVYPALMRHIERAWKRRVASDHRRPDLQQSP